MFSKKSAVSHFAAFRFAASRFPFLSSFFTFSLLALFVFIFASLGVKMAPDSSGYMGGDLIRAPLYPLFLKLNSTIFGAGEFTPLVVFQLGLGAFAVFRISRYLKEIFQLNLLGFNLLIILLLSPYLGFVGNYILTEALAYPLFLLATEILFRGLQTRQPKYFHLFFLYSGILCLIRGQFFFLFVISLMAMLYLFWIAKRTRLQKSILIASFLGVLLSTSLFERSYHAYYHNAFNVTPSVAVHFVIAPLYLANPEDAHLFQDSKLKSIFSKTQSKMEAQGLTHLSAVGNFDPPFHFYASFDEILYKALYPSLNELQFLDKHQNEILLNTIAITLIKAKPLEYLKLYTRNFTSYFGGYYGFIFMIVLMMSSLIVCLRKKEFYSGIVFFVALFDLGNALLTSLVQSYHLRYSFYTQIVLVAVLSLIAYKMSKHFLLNQVFINQNQR